MEPIKFKLYVTGKTFRSERAIETLRTIVESMGEDAEMAVIDILEDPELAEEDKILATPTLIKDAPRAYQRIIGDLSNFQKVIRTLEITGYFSKDKKEKEE